MMTNREWLKSQDEDFLENISILHCRNGYYADYYWVWRDRIIYVLHVESKDDIVLKQILVEQSIAFSEWLDEEHKSEWVKWTSEDTSTDPPIDTETEDMKTFSKEVLTTDGDDYKIAYLVDDGDKRWYEQSSWGKNPIDVVAWRLLPEPYEEGH